MIRRALLVVTIALATLSCTPQQGRTADAVQETVLRAKDLACVMGSTLVDPAELARLCKIVDHLEPLLPIIRNLVGVRDAARRTGVVYTPPNSTTNAHPDGGVHP